MADTSRNLERFGNTYESLLRQKDLLGLLALPLGTAVGGVLSAVSAGLVVFAVTGDLSTPDVGDIALAALGKYGFVALAGYGALKTQGGTSAFLAILSLGGLVGGGIVTINDSVENALPRQVTQYQPTDEHDALDTGKEVVNNTIRPTSPSGNPELHVTRTNQSVSLYD